MRVGDLIPDGDVLLALPAEEIAVAVLQTLNDEEKNHRRRKDSANNISMSNFCTLQGQQYQGVPQDRCVHAIGAAFQHLVNIGMLAPNPYSSPFGWFVLTERARAVNTRADYQRFKHASRYPRGSIHPTIEDLTFAEFLRGDYETAVFKAFKAIEDRVRTVCGYDAAMIGVPMMRKAFHPAAGPLTDSSEHEAEREALMHLFAAAIGRFKNPTSHRFTGMDDPVATIEILQLASLLLRIADERATASGIASRSAP